MANTTEVAAKAAPAPSREQLSRVQDWTREPLVDNGDALRAGTGLRRAIDAALVEIEAGRETPSIDWRRRYSLILGLERLLADDEPKLADGAVLSAHQVDALSGTLTVLIAEAERENRSASDDGRLDQVQPLLTDEVAEQEEEELEVEDSEDGELPDEEEIEPEGEDADWFAGAAPALEDQVDTDEVDTDEVDTEEGQLPEQPEDPGAGRRFWFEHATGAGKTVAALGFVEASRTGGILILTHRRNLVDQFLGELRDRGYADRISAPLLGTRDDAGGPVTVETYQWFVRNAGSISDAYAIVICDEAHTALGEKTSAAIRRWQGPVFIGMTATGALIARHVADLFPTQTSRFDLAQAARRGVIAPIRCIRISPGPNVRTLANVPLRRGEVDQDFDQQQLAALLDQGPFNAAVADLYRVRFRNIPGIVYSAGVRHAHNVAKSFNEAGIKARAVSGETPKRELAETLAAFERGEVDVLINAMLLAEGWNSPRATVCMHLAPTASRRVYQQRVGRVTRRNPGKEAGIVVDFVHPATSHDEAIVTLHKLLDRDVYRGGAIVVGPVRRGRGRRLRVERRIVPVTDNWERRQRVLERELWRIAVENLPPDEQHGWAALAGARVVPNGWRRAKAMLQRDSTGELRRRFLLECARRNRNPQLRQRGLTEIAALRDAEGFEHAVEIVGGWTREERREGARVLLQALAEKPIGRRDQAQAWLWRLAEYSRDAHEEYAVQRWPETKRLLGLLVNSSGPAHGRNARRLVHAARKHDRRLAAALLAAALSHSPEAEEVLRGARNRMARKPSAVARELVRNFPKGKRRGRKRRRRVGGPKKRSAGANKKSPRAGQTENQDQSRRTDHEEPA